MTSKFETIEMADGSSHLHMQHDLEQDEALYVVEGLDGLFRLMKSGAVDGQWDSLPTFGGEEPADTWEIWSWDESDMIVGTCADDIEIVPREEISDAKSLISLLAPYADAGEVIRELALADAQLFCQEFPGATLAGSDWDAEAWAQRPDDARAAETAMAAVGGSGAAWELYRRVLGLAVERQEKL